MTPTKEELDEAIKFYKEKTVIWKKVAEPSIPKHSHIIALSILTKYRDGELVEKGNGLSQKLKIAAASTYKRIGGERGVTFERQKLLYRG